jgi:outer membrane protein
MKKFLFVIILLCGVQIVFAQEKLSLQQAIEIGLKNNYSIIISKNDLDISKNNVSWGNAGALPALDLSLTQNNSIIDSKQKYSDGAEVNKTGATANSLDANALLNWTIFDGFKMFATYNKLKSFEEQGELNARLTVENTVSQIITAYYDIVRQNANLTVIDSSMEISRVKLLISKTKFEIGSTSKTEYLQAQVDMNADLSAYKTQQMRIEESKVNLNKLLARDVSLIYDVDDSIEINYNANYDDLKNKIEKTNTSVLLAQSNTNIYNYNIKEWKGQRLPTLNLYAGYNYTKANSQTGLVLQNKTNGLNYGFTLNYNLFNGFNLNRNIKNATLDYESSKINFESVKSEINAEMIIAYRDFQNNLELLKLEEANSLLAKENVDLSLARFRTGVIDQLQLKDAQQSYILAQIRLVLARYDTKIAETTLKKLTGELLK